MREIKFRGWNKVSKVMVDDIQVYSPKDTLSLNDCFDPGMIVLPLQYIGLKDKNGKEIYEGDIVQGGFEKSKGVITFGMYKPVMNTDKWEGHQSFYIKWHDWNGMTRGDLGYWLTKMETAIEVIGDIYSTPELLKAGKS